MKIFFNDPKVHTHVVKEIYGHRNDLEIRTLHHNLWKILHAVIWWQSLIKPSQTVICKSVLEAFLTFA